MLDFEEFIKKLVADKIIHKWVGMTGYRFFSTEDRKDFIQHCFHKIIENKKKLLNLESESKMFAYCYKIVRNELFDTSNKWHQKTLKYNQLVTLVAQIDLENLMLIK